MIINGDCRSVMAGMEANSVDAIVTDPPYGLSFMGKGWDKGVPGVEFWVEALRVAKPGAHLLAFGGTRMVHRLAVAIEDAGWEIRDRIHWVYGSGFPKSHNISKAIDKAAGAERRDVYEAKDGCKTNIAYGKGLGVGLIESNPATPEAQQWDGWGTALKPSVEPIILARKPFKGTVAANVLEWGTGAINVDGCRVGNEGGTKKTHVNERNIPSNSLEGGADGSLNGGRVSQINAGRWPANLIHDGSDEATAGMGDAARYFYCAKASTNDTGSFALDMGPAVEPIIMARKPFKGTVAANVLEWGTGAINVDGCRVGSEGGCLHMPGTGGFDAGTVNALGGHLNSARSPSVSGLGRWPANLIHDGSDEATAGMGDAARYFYCPKASKKDRGNGNSHPTVKPTDLMRYLCRLITPPGGTVLDPFCGSGSTGKAAVAEGFGFVGIEMDAEYAKIAESRLACVDGE